jgi:Protein of unknown function (DUF4054)
MTLDEFKAMFPEITDYTDAYMTLWIQAAVNMVDPDRFGSQYDYAVGLLSAHFITSDDEALTSSQTVGQMTVQYSNGEDNSHYNMTMYGRMYYRLMMVYGAGALIV